MLINQSDESDWLFNIQSRVLLADLFLLKNNGRAIFKLNMPYCKNTESKGGLGLCAYILHFKQGIA
mgnify:CR=1 FL=1